MKRILRHYTIETSILLLLSRVSSGMVFNRGIETILLAGAALTLTSIIAKPIINILLLPLNLITFGVFRWLSSAIALYIVTLLVKDFKIEYFHFEGISTVWFNIPTIHLQGIFAYIFFSFLLSIISSIIYWVIK